ncbi:uridine kinase [uncultured Jatrophihabitans sp.]|uniref:uridine kinase family protein n=1 Tax=uncultured Jatrophihabitans sp. TaxID=1610747 RepID=UPI0035CB6FA1
MAADQVVARIAALPAGTHFVGIDGFGAAGKTSLAELIAAAVPRAVVVHIDDFAAPDIVEWDWPRLRTQLIQPLRVGREACYQVSRWDLGLTDEWHTVAPGSIVIVEGVSSTRREVGAPWALTVWVDAPPDVRRARAIERDGDAMWPVWQRQWLPPEQAYAEREQPWARVDLVVPGSTR